MNLKTFNLLFLLALSGYNTRLKDLSTGSNGRHPTIGQSLIKAVKDDIKTSGLQNTIEKWDHFING